jgi:disulfide bond formation protein DsbB
MMRTPAWLIKARTLTVVILIVATGTIAGAWLFEIMGYLPCELCLKERTAYYAAVPLAALVVWLTSVRGHFGLASAGILGLALIFAASSIFGIYHTGVEWGWFPGPTECTGSYTPAPDINAFLKELNKVQVVRCDAPALHVLGLSLAAWNAIISAALTALAIAAAGRLSHGSSSVSQYK